MISKTKQARFQPTEASTEETKVNQSARRQISLKVPKHTSTNVKRGGQ